MQRNDAPRGWYSHAPTLSKLMRKVVYRSIVAPDPDVAVNIESHFYDVVLEADTCEYDLDVGRNLWLNRSRWSRLIREYVPLKGLDGLEVFIDQAKEIMSGKARKGATTYLMFREPDRYAKKHRWGGCLCAATFRYDPVQERPVLTLYSRTTYIGYMGLLDAAIAHTIARKITGDARDVAFRWHISSMQLHCFKTMPYVFSRPKILKQVKAAAKRIKQKGWTNPKKVTGTPIPPTMFYMAKWYLKILEAFGEHGVDMLEHEKYGPFKRIKRRWLEFEGHLDKHVPPSLSVGDLEFDKAE